LKEKEKETQKVQQECKDLEEKVKQLKAALDSTPATPSTPTTPTVKKSTPASGSFIGSPAQSKFSASSNVQNKASAPAPVNS
jgi:hypothetical protein